MLYTTYSQASGLEGSVSLSAWASLISSIGLAFGRQHDIPEFLERLFQYWVHGTSARACINGEGKNRRHVEVQPSMSLGGMAWNLKAVSVHQSAGIRKACPHHVTFSSDQCGFSVFDDGKVSWYPHQAVPQIVHSCATLLAYEVAPLSEQCCVQEHIQMLIVQHLIGVGSLDWGGQRVPHAARGSQSSERVSPKYGYMSLRGWACCNSVCYPYLVQKLQLLRGEREAASDTFEEQKPAMRGDGVALNTQGPPCHLDSTPMPRAIPAGGMPDAGFPGTHLLEENEYLPAIDDHIQRFDSDVQGLLNKFVGSGESFFSLLELFALFARHCIGLGFGWVGWLSCACRATSEPNSFIQSCIKEIFGGIRSES